MEERGGVCYLVKWKPKFKAANVSPAVPKCQFSALTMHKNLLQKKKIVKGNGFMTKLNWIPSSVWGEKGRTSRQHVRPQNTWRTSCRGEIVDVLSLGQPCKARVPGARLSSSQTPVTTGSVKDSRIDVRGNPTLTAIKPKVTPFNNTSCYIPPNYQQAN